MSYAAAKSIGGHCIDPEQNDLVGNKKVRVKFSVSLSEQTSRMFEELKQATDADTDSEVFRNALRLHLALIRAAQDGNKLFLKSRDSEDLVPLDLFGTYAPTSSCSS